jgi:FkbM family methyltransferase
MKVPAQLSYRVLFWVTLFFSALLAVFWYRENRRTASIAEAIGDARAFEPFTLAKLRDVKYPFTIEIYGYKYQGKTGNFIDERILAYGAYEKDVLMFMKDYVNAKTNPDAVFLDVGANTGQHSLFMSRHVKQVHAFEPLPPVADRFRQMVQLNGFSNIVLHEVGLADNEEVLPFYAPPEDNQGSGTFLPTHAEKGAQPVGSFRVVVGDKWLKETGVSAIELIKIDVEGYEKPVLKGLSATLAQNRPVLVVEVSQPPSGTIKSLDELRKLFPERYRFLKFKSTREYLIEGKYELLELSSLWSEGDIEMVVAYPAEHESLVPRMSRK